MTPEETAENFANDLDELCKKYGCNVGVWLSWRDMLHNFDIMKQDPKMDELHFGLQIRIHGADDKDKTGNKE